MHRVFPEARIVRWIAALCVAAVCLGCLARSDKLVKKEDSQPEQEDQVVDKLEDSSPPSSHGVAVPPDPKDQPSEWVQGTKRPARVEAEQASHQSAQPLETQAKVRAAALKVAKDLESAVKMKICRFVKEDEWWVMIYDDVGPVIDIKQFVWDSEMEQLEPYLVVKKIAKTRLDAHLKTREAGKECTIVSPPWDTQQER